MITKELLNKIFQYKDGELYWKEKTSPYSHIKIGDKAGCVNKEGYVVICVNKKIHKAHRLIFLMHHGYLPKEIDHKDTNPLNNRIENLREATTSQNGYNKNIQKNNKSGSKNVSWSKVANKWAVQIKVNGNLKHIGYFEDLELADLVAQEARDLYHGEFARA